MNGVVHCKAVNRMRVTKSKRNSRRSHHSVSVSAHTIEEDGVVRTRHRASRLTGKYRGRQVVDSTQIAKTAENKAQQKQEEGTEEKRTVEQVEAPK